MVPLLRVLALAALLLSQGCAPLPSLADRPESIRFEPAADSRLGRSIVALAAAHPGRSGVLPLLRGDDAFAARVRLADAAERSLDVQYYIWHRDLSGTLLMNALRRAADRGVRVRLLLDDNNTAGLDAPLAALAARPNVEIRLFNPFRARNLRPAGWLFDFARLNRRMHNKSFTADNLATIVGGRNIGDEYFGAAGDALFVDLDVLAIGPVVDEVSRDFDRYWSSESAYPARDLLPATDAPMQAAFELEAQRVQQEPAAGAYLKAVAQSPFVQQLLDHRLDFEWAPVHLVSDDPAKALGEARPDQLLWSKLKQEVAAPARELRLISPYFVPGEQGTADFVAMARRGVRVQVLTNSLAATDVMAVHAGYALRRKALLAAGVVLFEMKRSLTAPVSGRPFAGSSGVSGSSLHAKTFSIDDRQVFIGSFNFDPRSAELNTEMGFVIDSPALARSIGQTFARELPNLAYRLRLAPDGALQWVERSGASEVVHGVEPGSTWWQRLGVSILSWLPIESLL